MPQINDKDMSKIKTPEETFFRVLWKKALELGFQCNETDAHELTIVAKEHSDYRMKAVIEELGILINEKSITREEMYFDAGLQKAIEIIKSRI